MEGAYIIDVSIQSGDHYAHFCIQIAGLKNQEMLISP